MTDKDAYVANLKAKLDRWSAEIDELEARTRKNEAQAKEVYYDRIADLKAKREELSDKVEEIQNASSDAWGNLKDGANRVSDEVSRTLEETKKSFLEVMRD